MGNDEILRQEVNIGALFIVIAFVSFSVLAGLFLGKAVEVQLYYERAQLFQTILIVFGTAIAVTTLVGALLRKAGGKYYEKAGWIGNVIHDPDEGMIFYLLSKTKTFRNIKKYSHPKYLFLIGVIIFSIMGMTFSILNTFFNDIPFAAGQITEFGMAISEIEPAATSETLFLLFFCGLWFSICRWLKYKYDWGDDAYWGMKVLEIPLSIVFWIAFHTYAYAGSEKDLFSMAIMAIIISTTFFMTGSILMPILYHQINNLFQVLNDSALSNDAIVAITMGIILITIVIFGITLTLKKRETNLGTLAG